MRFLLRIALLNLGDRVRTLRIEVVRADYEDACWCTPVVAVSRHIAQTANPGSAREIIYHC